MDILDIYSIPEDTRVIVTVEELRYMFARARRYGEIGKAYASQDYTIKGEIV